MDKPKIHRPVMEKFYFTYGNHPNQPFEGGWTLIYAPNMASAQQIFKMYHPNPDGTKSMNCCAFYTHEEFVQEKMFLTGNRGAFCHEVICPKPPETSDMETLASRDKRLMELWMHFGDVPMFPDTECMEENFLQFPAGTHREEIWKWFDQRHSKGVGYLLYGDGNDRTTDLANLAYRKTLCEECGCINCVFHSDGICKFALIYGEKPSHDKHRGCLGYAEKPELCWQLEEKNGV